MHFLLLLEFLILLEDYFSEGTFNAAFVPSYTSEIVKGKKSSNKFANDIFNLLFLGLFFLLLVVQIFMPAFVSIIAPGFVEDNEKMELEVIKWLNLALALRDAQNDVEDEIETARIREEDDGIDIERIWPKTTPGDLNVKPGAIFRKLSKTKK